ECAVGTHPLPSAGRHVAGWRDAFMDRLPAGNGPHAPDSRAPGTSGSSADRGPAVSPSAATAGARGRLARLRTPGAAFGPPQFGAPGDRRSGPLVSGAAYRPRQSDARARLRADRSAEQGADVNEPRADGWIVPHWPAPGGGWGPIPPRAGGRVA